EAAMFGLGQPVGTVAHLVLRHGGASEACQQRGSSRQFQTMHVSCSLGRLREPAQICAIVSHSQFLTPWQRVVKSKNRHMNEMPAMRATASIRSRQARFPPLASAVRNTASIIMAIPLNPTRIHPPFAPYSHGMLIPE